MTRNEIISALQQFFTIQELVCPHCYKRWGANSWQFLDTDYLHALLIIRRDILQQPMYCNHGAATQRGLRCNMCDYVKGKSAVYLSAHILGKAGDFTVQNMTAADARRRIQACSHMLPCNIRIEDGVSWLHFDVLPQYGIDQKVYLFKS